MADYEDVVDENRLIDSYLNRLSNESTREAYRTSIRLLQEFVGDLRLLELEEVDIQRFIRKISQTKAPSTVGQRIGALANFYAYAVARHLITRSPMDGIERPKIEHGRGPSGYTLQDFQSILGVTEELRDRDAAVILLILLAGFRVSDVTVLNVADVRLDGDVVHLTLTKRGRMVTLPPIIAKRIKPLTDGRRPEEPLFVASTGNRYIRRLLAEMVLRVGKKANVPKPLTPIGMQTLMYETALASGVAPWDLSDAVGAKDFRSFIKLAPEPANNDQHPAFHIIRRLSDPGPLSDLQQQVDALLADPDVQPVAPMVVAGALLESRLRAMVHTAGLVIKGKPGISSYAQALRQADLITETERKELDLLGSWRNRAAHGEDLLSLKDRDAVRMAEGVSIFLEHHP